MTCDCPCHTIPGYMHVASCCNVERFEPNRIQRYSQYALLSREAIGTPVADRALEILAEHARTWVRVNIGTEGFNLVLTDFKEEEITDEDTGRASVHARATVTISYYDPEPEAA